MTYWPQEYSSYGVARTFPRQVWVYKDNWNYMVVYTDKEVQSSIWSGGALIVVFRDGSCRRYINNIQYERVG